MRLQSAVLKSLMLAALTLATGLSLWFFFRPAPPEHIRIGVLQSLTGTMSTSEKPLVDAVRLAVNEINAQGGVLGRPVDVIVADGHSNPAVFAQEAENLIVQEKVSVIFGCWTSSERKAVKPIVERYKNLLFYPLQYEGLEQSPHIIYTGSTPNQQIIPATHWALKTLGKRVYLLGSDALFPRTANRIITDFIHVAAGEVLGERYVPLENKDFDTIVAEIVRLKPDVIINTVNGNSNETFFKALGSSVAKNTPVLSFSITENELQHFPHLTAVPHYAAWAYFQSIDTPVNRRFVTAFQRLDPIPQIPRVTSDPVEASYFGVHLWAQAAEDINSTDPERVNPAVLRQSYHAPSGIVSVDKSSRYTWKMLRIAKAETNGQFKILESSPFPIRPEPFPSYRSHDEWQQIIADIAKESP